MKPCHHYRSQHPHYSGLADKPIREYYHLRDGVWRHTHKSVGVPDESIFVWTMAQERLLWCAFNGFPYQRSATDEWHYQRGQSQRREIGHPFG